MIKLVISITSRSRIIISVRLSAQKHFYTLLQVVF